MLTAQASIIDISDTNKVLVIRKLEPLDSFKRVVSVGGFGESFFVDVAEGDAVAVEFLGTELLSSLDDVVVDFTAKVLLIFHHSGMHVH